MNNAKAKRRLWHILLRVAIDPDAVTLREWNKAYVASRRIGRRDDAGIGLGEIHFSNGVRLPIGPGILRVSCVKKYAQAQAVES